MYLRSYHIAVYNECEIQEQHLYITLRERKTEFTLLLFYILFSEGGVGRGGEEAIPVIE